MYVVVFLNLTIKQNLVYNIEMRNMKEYYIRISLEKDH